MSNILDIAQEIYDQYYDQTHETIDELKLQKLLYFSQRESLAITNKVLFDDNFEGWIHGPVSTTVRMYYTPEIGINKIVSPVTHDIKRLIANVLSEYGHIASWKLRDLSHEEISWSNSRIGLSCSQRGDRILDIDDIREDAKKVRPFDSTWGMYYDEFDDYDGELSDCR